MARIDHIIPDQPDPPMPTEMSGNQLAEQWFAYRKWLCGLTHPHTLNWKTGDAVYRKEFRLWPNLSAP